MRAVRVFSYLPLFALLICVGGRAAEPDEQTTDLWLMAKYDVDGDRAISINEISRKREKLFSRMDADSDGEVSFEEYQNLDTRKRELLLKARFVRLDADHDGRLSTAEYGSYSGAFDQLDMNGDGRLTEAEMAAEQSLEVVESSALAENTHCLLWFCIKTELD